MSDLEINDEVNLNQDADQFQLVDSAGAYPTGPAVQAYGVTQDTEVSGEDVAVTVWGKTKIQCSDATVSKGDLVQAAAAGDGTVASYTSTTGDLAVAVALEDCDTAGEHVRFMFFNLGLESN